MYTAILFVHNLLRWVILILLVINIVKLAIGSANVSLSKWLLIAAHTTLIIGLYQYFAGPYGYAQIQQMGMSAVMKDDTARFWAVEHISGMIIAVAFITVGHVGLKKGNTRKANLFFVLALILILALVPWPFRHLVSRPLLPHM